MYSVLKRLIIPKVQNTNTHTYATQPFRSVCVFVVDVILFSSIDINVIYFFFFNTTTTTTTANSTITTIQKQAARCYSGGALILYIKTNDQCKIYIICNMKRAVPTHNIFSFFTKWCSV